MNSLIRPSFLSNLLLALTLVVSVSACSTVDRAIGIAFGTDSEIAQSIDTPLKQWAVAQQTLSAATDAAAGAIETGAVPLEIARKIATFQADAQTALDEAFNAITASETKTKSGLTWQEAINIAKTKTSSINSLMELFKR